MDEAVATIERELERIEGQLSEDNDSWAGYAEGVGVRN